MAKYHVNYMGNPGICRAAIECPFGGDDAHYSSKDEARLAYESHMAGLTQAQNDKEFAHLEDRPTPNSSWNKYRRILKDVDTSELTSMNAVVKTYADAMKSMGPVELFYLAEKSWPDEKAQVLAKDEIARRKALSVKPTAESFNVEEYMTRADQIAGANLAKEYAANLENLSNSFTREVQAPVAKRYRELADRITSESPNLTRSDVLQLKIAAEKYSRDLEKHENSFIREASQDRQKRYRAQARKFAEIADQVGADGYK